MHERRARRRASAAGVALGAWLAAGTADVHAADISSRLESGESIQYATFSLRVGAVYVNLPNDLAAGEPASGTVNPVPASPGTKDEAKQREELHRFGVVLGGSRAPTSQRVRTFTVPAGASGLEIALVDPKGKKVAAVTAKLSSAPAAAAEGYRVPQVGQSGATVAIAGPFDGDLSNSSVRIGEADADPVAESRRQLVIRGPREAATTAPVEVKERGAVVTTGTYRNVDVSLAAEATTLHSGQRTTLSVTVSGVEGLRETLPVRLVNHSTSVVSVEGGDQQTLCVRPDEVGTTGTWTAKRGLTGVRLGAFSIGAEVQQPRPHAEGWARIEGSPRGELRAGVVLEREARGPGGEALSPGGYAIRVRGGGEGGAVELDLKSREGKVATLSGAVFKRVRSATVCDREDVQDAAGQARAGTGTPSFDELGFANDETFDLRESEGRMRLNLTTEEEEFSIEAELPTPAP